ncbi:5-methylcytosine-specific restriction endonuclease system specificity protein McrC [Caloramator sp. E03]|nr:5-methylcytosine-specific restriction endonuclease system specificity protein McrC [Caloramator sp. E03]
MLCYAWDRLKEKDEVKVSQSDFSDIYNLLSRVLINNLEKLIKKGFYKEYNVNYKETSTLRGKINFNDSLKHFGFKRGKLYCEFDDFSYNILYNQIIKTILYILIKYKYLDEEYKEKIYEMLNYFEDISLLRLKSEHFSKVKLNKNNLYYGFVLDICQLIFDNCLIDESKGDFLFKDFERDDRAMAYLFENFVRNFYKRECKEFKVYRENINWAEKDSKVDLLPIMQTDISLESADRKIIIDTKYYKNSLSNNYGAEKLISSNLYQLFAYLKNIEYKSDKDINAEGILIYPKTSKELNLRYVIHGHKIKICTVDLNRDWQVIHNRLIEIIRQG